jgi:hypothetical protein
MCSRPRISLREVCKSALQLTLNWLGGAEDVADVLCRVGGVGGVDDQDDVGFAGVAFEDLILIMASG